MVIIRELVKIDQNIRLILVGEGSDEDKIRQYIARYEIEDYVLLVKPVTNIEDYYSAFDLFVLPSRWEGFGIAALEAQVSGLISIFSEHVIQDVVLCIETKSISLENHVSWKNEIMQIAFNGINEKLRRERSNNAANNCMARGYSFDYSRDTLIAIYKDLMNKNIYSGVENR